MRGKLTRKPHRSNFYVILIGLVGKVQRRPSHPELFLLGEWAKSSQSHHLRNSLDEASCNFIPRRLRSGSPNPIKTGIVLADIIERLLATSTAQ